MRLFSSILCILCAPLISVEAQNAIDAAEVDTRVIELREAISKLVDLQTLESKERNDWAAKKASFAGLLELHRRELELLNEELAKAGKTAPTHDSQASDLEKQIEALKQARRLTAEAVARNLPRLTKLAAAFPKPLLDDLEPDLAALMAHKPTDEPRKALQAMLNVISEAEQFNRRFTRSTEVRDGSEVQVLYLGLAQAYYMNGGNNAGIGRPTADGWKWKKQEDVSEPLQAAFEIMDKKRPPTTVILPLTLD